MRTEVVALPLAGAAVTRELEVEVRSKPTNASRVAIVFGVALSLWCVAGLAEEALFADDFNDGDALSWSWAAGLEEGANCSLTAQCSDGLLCCYPCGIPDCLDICLAVPEGEVCPVAP